MISGRTRLFAIIADPVVHVRTPQAFNALFAERGLDHVLVPVHVAADDLAGMLAGLRRLRNLGGFVVTVPHKQAIVALCDELGPAARRIGAVNAVRREADGRLVGEMFDGIGFVAGLRGQGHEPAGRRALLLGAGGAASAIAFALAEAGVAELTVANRTPEKARALADAVAAAFPAVPVRAAPADAGGFDLVVNATTLGLKPEDPLPVPVASIGSNAIVAEVIMQPEVTALLAAAAERGAVSHGGIHMLDAQIAAIGAFIGALPDDNRQANA